VLTFTVPGTPVPQGSKRAFGNRVVDSNSKALKPWRATITSVALEANAGADPISGPVEVQLVFTFPHPKTHFRTGKNAGVLKDSAPQFVTVKPDLDKLIRAVLDGLTDAQIFRDDSQVVSLEAIKLYGTYPQVKVIVNPCSPALQTWV